MVYCWENHHNFDATGKIQYQVILFLYLKEMGNAESQDKSFIRQEWILEETNDRFKQWRSRIDINICLEEYSISCSSDEQQNRQQQIYKLRKDHPQIVSSYFLMQDKQNNLCSTISNMRVLIEKIPIRLSDVEHIPLIDSIHVFSQCLLGYYHLSRYFGFFPVIEEMIGINEMGIAKVWVNQDYSQISTHGRISEEKMVETIIETVNNAIDKIDQKNKRPIKSYFYLHSDRLKFQQAIAQLQSYSNQFFKGAIPPRLECIDRAGGVWSIANFQKKSNINYQKKSSTVESYNRPRLVDSTILKQQTQKKINKRASVIIYDQPKSQIVMNRYRQLNEQKGALPPVTLNSDAIITRRKGSSFQGFEISNHKVNPNIEKLTNSQIFSKSSIPPQSNVRISQVIPVPNHRFMQIKIPSQNYVTGIQQAQQNRFIADKRMPQDIPSILPQRKLSQTPSLIQLVKEQNLDYSQSNWNKNQIYSGRLPSKHQANEFKQQRLVYIPQLRNFQYKSNKVDDFLLEKPSSSKMLNNQNMNNQIRNSQLIYEKTPQKLAANDDICLPSRQKINIEQGHTVDYKLINNKSNNTKISQYTTIDIQDGKSSLDFMRKLKQFIPSKHQPFILDTEHSQNNIESQALKQQRSQSLLGIERAGLTRQVTSSRNLIPQDAYEDFGRNAVSNIVSNQSNIYKTSHKDTNRQIFKFENNLQMKYSIFKADDSFVFERQNNSPAQTFAKYQSRLDPELYADLAKIKS